MKQVRVVDCRVCGRVRAAWDSVSDWCVSCVEALLVEQAAELDDFRQDRQVVDVTRGHLRLVDGDVHV